MKYLTIPALALAVLLGSLGAHAQAQDPRDVPPPPAPVVTPADTGTRPDPYPLVAPGKLSDFEQRFLASAAQAGAAEIEASRLLIERSRNIDLKNFAQMMVSDHGDADQQLKQLATAKRINLPQGATPEDQKAIEKLRTLDGDALDREYLERFGVQAHRQAVALFERAANQSKNADVKNLARGVLPTLRRHLEMAEQLAAGPNPKVPPAISGGPALMPSTSVR
jgi:putative membrane protein